jgi:DNA-binding response OmpR family regulator
MAELNYVPISAALYELDPELTAQLEETLSDCCSAVSAFPSATDLRKADVIFCPPDVNQVRKLRSHFPRSSVVVASRLPEVTDWLDSLEAGAADYCAAPFETGQIRWVLESHQRSARPAA